MSTGEVSLIRLLRVPLVAVATVCCQYVWTPPSRARKEERLPVRGLNERIVGVQVAAVGWIKVSML
jgi:hypothetical protein